MHTAIDVAGDVVRSRTTCSTGNEAARLFGIAGIPPRIPRESFVWNRPRAARSSRPRVVVSLASIWSALRDAEPGTFQWQYDAGAQGNRTLTDMIGEALVQNVSLMRQAKTVVAVDNLLSEVQQELLLQSLSAAGASDIELLWRPIALVLAYLNADPKVRFKDGDKLLVVDAESTLPEVTCIQVKEHGGRLLPLRGTPVPHVGAEYSWGAHALRRRIAHALAGDRSEVAAQLLEGPYTEQFVGFTEGRTSSLLWHRDGPEYRAIDISSQQALAVRKGAVRDISPNTIQSQISAQHSFDSMAAVLWHGWPLRECITPVQTRRDVVLPPDAVALGADIYGARLLAGEPAYLDTLPGLYIMSEVTELKAFAYFPLVVPGTWEGGRIWRLPVPRKEFSVVRSVAQFPAVLRRSDEPECRRVVTSIPAPEQNTPVIIRAEMRPAHGRARVTIEGAEGHEGVFGDQRVVTLDWSTMKAIDDPLVSAPSVYPVCGRLFDEEDPEYRDVLASFLDNRRGTMATLVTYRRHKVPFWKLMQPWGYSPPWHNAPGVPAGWESEPTRGMFGSEYQQCDALLLNRLAERIEATASPADRVKYLNYMFLYVPESFKHELREKFSEEAPDFASWNWVIAPGRVFSTRTDIELFIAFMMRVSHGAYPVYPDASYTPHYWWSFFRCLCYHHDAVNTAPDRVLQVLEMLHTYISDGAANSRSAKYCLCAILFATRLRARLPDFLQPGDELCRRLVDDVSKRMPKVPYPPAMLANVEDPFGEGLNGLVLRFLLQTASEKDLRVLSGLTTSMA